MSKQVKLVVLFFVFLLSFSVSKEQENSVRLNLANVHPGVEDSTSFFLEGKPAKAFGLHRVNEIVVNSVVPLTGPDSKVYLDHLVSEVASFEQRIQNIALAFLSDANKIQLSLSVRAIIFPFHFFW